MTKTLTLLFASAALTAALGLPAWSAMQAPGTPSISNSIPAVLQQASDGAKLFLVDDDEDENEGYGTKRNAGREDEDDDDGCEEDEGSCGSANNPAPAGSAAPPQNGLFGDGAAPKAQVN